MAFRKNIITIEPPPAIYACSDSIYLFNTLLCYIASIFHVLTRFRAATTYYVADFSDEEYGSLGRCRALSYTLGVDGLTLSSKPSAVIVLDGLKPYSL